MSPRIIGRSITQPAPSISPPSLVPSPSTPPPPSFCEEARTSQLGCRTCEIDDLRVTLAGYLQTLKDHGADGGTVVLGKGSGNWSSFIPPPSPPSSRSPPPPLTHVHSTDTASESPSTQAPHDAPTLSESNLQDDDSALPSRLSSDAATSASSGAPLGLIMAAGLAVAGLLLFAAAVAFLRKYLRAGRASKTTSKVVVNKHANNVSTTADSQGAAHANGSELTEVAITSTANATLSPQSSEESEVEAGKI